MPDAETDETGETETGARSRSSRLLSLAGWSVLGVVVLGVAWVVVTAVFARNQLNAANRDVARLRQAVVAGDLGRATALEAQVRGETDDAHFLTSGPAWWVAANIPGLGTPLHTGRTLSTEAVRLSHDVLPAVVDVARTLTTRRDGPTVDTAVMARAVRTVGRATAAVDMARSAVAASAPSWLSPVGDARSAVVDELGRLGDELQTADRAARIALPMLGADRPQRYFVGFLNEAEMRGGGGIPGAFAIAVVDHGRIRFEHFGTDADFGKVHADVPLTADQRARYGNADITDILVNSNLSPDFSLTGRIWAGMWQDKTGERVDGAIAIDPTALSYLLRVTGSAPVVTGPAASADSIVGLTQKVQYSLYPGVSRAATTERKRYLVALARAVSTRLTTATDLPRLLKAVSAGVAERRVTVWSAVPSLESRLQQVGWGGTLGTTDGAPYSGFVVNNAAGSKLDYYLQRSMTYRRTDCGAGGTATATFEVSNTAPKRGLPAYVTFRADKPPYRVKPGDTRMLVTYYAARSARIVRATLDGRPVSVGRLPEGSTTTATFDVELPAGASKRLVVTVQEPASSTPVTLLEQPGVRRLTTSVSGGRCA